MTDQSGAVEAQGDGLQKTGLSREQLGDDYDLLVWLGVGSDAKSSDPDTRMQRRVYERMFDLVSALAHPAKEPSAASAAGLTAEVVEAAIAVAEGLTTEEATGFYPDNSGQEDCAKRLKAAVAALAAARAHTGQDAGGAQGAGLAANVQGLVEIIRRNIKTTGGPDRVKLPSGDWLTGEGAESYIAMMKKIADTLETCLAAARADQQARGGEALRLGPEEVSYQVEQGEDGVIAEAFSMPEDAARREALHYAAVYGQDGPVSLFRVSRREWTPEALPHAVESEG